MDELGMSDTEERSRIRQEFSTMPFEELQKLKEKIGSKIVDKALFEKEEKVALFTRENKNRPREMSSKLKASKLKRKNTDLTNKQTIRDPRFDDLSGTFNEGLFRKSYSFIEELRSKEIQELKERIQTTKDPKRKQEIKALVRRMDEKEKAQEKKRRIEERMRSHKREQLENIKRGKKPFFLKKSELKRENLMEKFERLKKSGKLEQYMSKKRKQNAAKEKKKLPSKVKK